jgi:hypothetical protein
LITKLYGYLGSNSLLFYGGLFGVFLSYRFVCTYFLTEVLNEANQNLLAVFSTYLCIGLISVIAALAILCLLYANSV